jgi:hypothetical protein
MRRRKIYRPRKETAQGGKRGKRWPKNTASRLYPRPGAGAERKGKLNLRESDSFQAGRFFVFVKEASMPKQNGERDVYVIPPNFIEGGALFGGMFKLRNAIEAGALAVLTAMPVFKTSLSFTTKIIVLCVTALPLALFALIGVNGDSLSTFVFNFFRFVKRRRVLTRSDLPPAVQPMEAFWKKVCGLYRRLIATFHKK